MKLAFVLPVVAVADVPLTMSWDEWKNHFGMEFNSDDESRKDVYESNVAFIEAENAKGHTYVLGVNHFSHLSEEEFIAQYTGAQGGDVINAEDAHMGELEVGTRADSVDWTTTKGVVNAIKDQGQCGSCWAFSAVGTVESVYALASGKLHTLSEQQLLDCQDWYQSGCDGGYNSKAMTYISKYGSCSQTSYPYKAKDFRDGDTCEAGNTEHGSPGESKCSFTLSPGVVSGYNSISKNKDGLESALNQSPVSVTLKADSALQQYRSGVLSESCSTFGQPNHAVIAVGYDSESFKIRNSWGSSWGEDGYFRIANDLSNPVCIFKQNPVVPTMATEAYTV